MRKRGGIIFYVNEKDMREEYRRRCIMLLLGFDSAFNPVHRIAYGGIDDV